MLQLELWPAFERGASLGDKYTIVNDILLALARDVGVDLWTLDAIFWWLNRPGELPRGMNQLEGSVVAAEVSPTVPLQVVDTLARFGLERHLHDFLFDNWSYTPLARQWRILAEPGDPQAGYEYACPIGRIDLLARHVAENKWLVIELKRDRATDAVVGQVLKYMGWVQHHLAEPGAVVHGLIIAPDVDAQLQYAVSAVSRLQAMTYEVQFRLIDAPQILNTAISGAVPPP